MHLEPIAVKVTAIADTGARTTTAGEDLLKKLGCSLDFLLHTERHLHAEMTTVCQ